MPLTRKEVKEFLDHCQMDAPTEFQFWRLVGHVARELEEFQGMVHDGAATLRPDKVKVRTGEMSITLKSYYFDGRQGITFEPDWVGVAGWADDTNVQPLLRALVSWAEEISGGVYDHR